MALQDAGWVVWIQPEITPLSNSRQLRDTTLKNAPAVVAPMSMTQKAMLEFAPVKPAVRSVVETLPSVCAPPNSAEVCPTITKGAETYIDLRTKGYKNFKTNEQANEKAGASWARNTAPNVRSTACLFSRILGDKPFDQISDPEMTAAWELMARLPRSYQAKTSKMSHQEAAEETDATEKHNQEVTRVKLEKKGASPGKSESEKLMCRIRRLRTATIYRHMQDFQRICVFLRKRGHLTANIMEDHIWDSAEYERRDSRLQIASQQHVTGVGKYPGIGGRMKLEQVALSHRNRWARHPGIRNLCPT